MRENLDERICLSVEGQPAECLTCGLEDARVALAVTGSKRLHHAVDLLGLAGQTEAPQELPAIRGETGSGGRVRATLRVHVAVCVGEALCSPERLHQVQVSKLMQVHKGQQHLDVEVVSRGEKEMNMKKDDLALIPSGIAACQHIDLYFFFGLH